MKSRLTFLALLICDFVILNIVEQYLSSILFSRILMRSMLHNLVLTKYLFKWRSFLNVGAFAMEIVSTNSFNRLTAVDAYMRKSEGPSQNKS